MSLIRKQTTEAMLAANRVNTLRFTGPVPDVGKMNVRLNDSGRGKERAQTGSPLSRRSCTT